VLIVGGVALVVRSRHQRVPGWAPVERFVEAEMVDGVLVEDGAQ